MRNKLALALILFGAVAVTTASASMPQKARPLTQQLRLPDCTCSMTDELSTRYGVLDVETGKCHLEIECLVPEK